MESMAHAIDDPGRGPDDDEAAGGSPFFG